MASWLNATDKVGKVLSPARDTVTNAQSGFDLFMGFVGINKNSAGLIL